MTPDIVVDIGNSRMKWGRVEGGKVVEMVSLLHDDPVNWKRQVELWNCETKGWAIASVAPKQADRFCEWLKSRNANSLQFDNDSVLKSAAEFGFSTSVKQTDRIGIDRLLTTIAARNRTPIGSTTIAISVGTAMTVDFVRDNGEHVGGAILPGPYLMAKSLHDYTAKLPQIEIDSVVPMRVWGSNTNEAIELGIASAVLGAADQFVWDWFAYVNSPPCVFVTGGDSGYFRGFAFTAKVSRVDIEPTLTLEGIRLVAERLS